MRGLSPTASGFAGRSSIQTVTTLKSPAGGCGANAPGSDRGEAPIAKPQSVDTGEGRKPLPFFRYRALACAGHNHSVFTTLALINTQVQRTAAPVGEKIKTRCRSVAPKAVVINKGSIFNGNGYRVVHESFGGVKA
jgi:hypothetical protein